MPDSVVIDPSELVVVQVEVNSVMMSVEVDTGGNVAMVVKEVPDWITTPDFVATDPSELVVVQVEMNSLVIPDSVDDGGKVAIVVNDVPD